MENHLTTGGNFQQTSKIPKAMGPYQTAVAYGNLMFLSGQIGINPSTGELAGATIESQTTQVMENIKAILEAEGLSLNQVVKTTIFLTRMEDFATVNQVYGEYFQGKFPARSTVGVKALPKGALVEIEAIAGARTRRS